MTPRQKEIVEHAISLISRRGIQNLTIRNIADGIGISEPAIYRHYKSKTDIVLAVIDSLERSVFGEPGNPEDLGFSTLSIYINRLLRRFETAPELAAVVFSDEIFMNNERLVVSIRSLMEDTLERITRLIVAGQRNKELRQDIPSDDLALIVVGTIRLVVRQWHISGFDFDLTERGERVLQSLLILAGPDT